MMWRIPLTACHSKMVTVAMLALVSVASAFSSTNQKLSCRLAETPIGNIIETTRPMRVDSALYAMNKVEANDDVSDSIHMTTITESRRKFLASMASIGLASASSVAMPWQAAAADGDAPTQALPEVQVLATGDVKKLFNEGRALEGQGNILAAQRLYLKVTKIAPRFIYGWSNLGNTLVAQGQLGEAEDSYSKAVSLCEENLKQTEASFGTKRCDDLYMILLNRGSVRLNNDMPKEALLDLQKSTALRGRPDAVILQNLARAQEINSFYSQSDRSYTTAISMTADEVNPVWLRSSMVKYQLGDSGGAMDLLKRVENRFPDAPEVRAAYAVQLLGKGDEDAARKKFLEIPDRARLKYAEEDYLNKVIAWPPKMKEGVSYLTKAVGDSV